jgi:hypothetical protein
MTYQLRLFAIPFVSRGQEWLYTADSTGFHRYFTRPAGSKGPFYNQFAGPSAHPKNPNGNGEAVNEFGNLVRSFVPDASYRRFLVGQQATADYWRTLSTYPTEVSQ